MDWRFERWRVEEGSQTDQYEAEASSLGPYLFCTCIVLQTGLQHYVCSEVITSRMESGGLMVLQT